MSIIDQPSAMGAMNDQVWTPLRVEFCYIWIHDELKQDTNEKF